MTNKKIKLIGKYQLFGTKIEITSTDLDKFKPLLKSWNQLNDHLVSFTKEEDIMKLLIIEQLDKARPELLRRIHSRLISVRRTKEREELKI